MSRVALVQRFASLGVVAAASLAGVAAASAADFSYDEPPPVQRPYIPPPPPVVQYEPQIYVPPPPRVVLPPRQHVEVDPDGCRVIVREYDDAYGREVTRRTRDCAERDYSALLPRPAYPLPHEQYRPYTANPRPVVPDADDFD